MRRSAHPAAKREPETASGFAIPCRDPRAAAPPEGWRPAIRRWRCAALDAHRRRSAGGTRAWPAAARQGEARAERAAGPAGSSHRTVDELVEVAAGHPVEPGQQAVCERACGKAEREELEHRHRKRAAFLVRPAVLTLAHAFEQRAIANPEQGAAQSGARLERAEAVHRYVGVRVAGVTGACEGLSAVLPEEQSVPLRKCDKA